MEDFLLWRGQPSGHNTSDFGPGLRTGPSHLSASSQDRDALERLRRVPAFQPIGVLHVFTANPCAVNRLRGPSPNRRGPLTWCSICSPQQPEAEHCRPAQGATTPASAARRGDEVRQDRHDGAATATDRAALPCRTHQPRGRRGVRRGQVDGAADASPGGCGDTTARREVLTAPLRRSYAAFCPKRPSRLSWSSRCSSCLVSWSAMARRSVSSVTRQGPGKVAERRPELH